MAEVTCTWCAKTFSPRRGGSRQRFCCAGHRKEFHSLTRSWAERAIDAGVLSISDLQKGDTGPCTPRTTGRTPVEVPDIDAIDPALLPALRRRGTMRLTTARSGRSRSAHRARLAAAQGLSRPGDFGRGRRRSRRRGAERRPATGMNARALSRSVVSGGAHHGYDRSIRPTSRHRARWGPWQRRAWGEFPDAYTRACVSLPDADPPPLFPARSRVGPFTWLCRLRNFLHSRG
jgi:hypothetical protein